MDVITSVQNPKVKSLLTLREKSRDRRGKGLFTVEGRRETVRCAEAGFIPEEVYLCREIILPEEASGVLDAVTAANPQCRCYEVSPAVYAKAAYREGTEGVIAVFRQKNLELKDLQLSASPLLVVLESVEKPGNLGAVLRSADAAGADAVIVCDPLTDLYNPNLIRSSTGGIFTVPTVACTSARAIAWLKEKGIGILTAQLQDSVPYYHTPMTGPVAIVFGTEATGLSETWRQAADAHIMIPMLGRLDSLNVSVSASILLFEAVRQRQLWKNGLE
ncbi:MAG: RNA methyltransferase [Bacteroidales bacterium]|nr:RNA methyltransferase [Bacteroidales bacterium]